MRPRGLMPGRPTYPALVSVEKFSRLTRASTEVSPRSVGTKKVLRRLNQTLAVSVVEFVAASGDEPTSDRTAGGEEALITRYAPRSTMPRSCVEPSSDRDRW